MILVEIIYLKLSLEKQAFLKFPVLNYHKLFWYYNIHGDYKD